MNDTIQSQISRLKFCPLSCGGHVDNQCENDGIIWDCRGHHCGAVTAVLILWLGMFTEFKIEEIINMKPKIILCILLNFMLIMLASCSSIREPDIVLKENGQPCISIPRSEDMLRTNRPFNITSTHIYQTSIRSYLSEKYYQEEQYYVKASGVHRF